MQKPVLQSLYLTALELCAIDVHDLELPALAPGQVLVHAKNLQRKQRSFVATSAWNERLYTVKLDLRTRKCAR